MPDFATLEKIVLCLGTDAQRLLFDDMTSGQPVVYPTVDQLSPIMTTGKKNSRGRKRIKPLPDPMLYRAANTDTSVASDKEALYVCNPIPSGAEAIPIVDAPSANGTGIISEDRIIRLPYTMLKRGMHQCLRIAGKSMSPTLREGGFLIIRLLSRSEWKQMTGGRIYVLVDTDEKTHIRRIDNNLASEGILRCSSDAPDKHAYPDYEIKANAIGSIWEAEWYLTSDLYPSDSKI